MVRQTGGTDGGDLVHCDCDCEHFGGVSATGWIVIFSFIGLLVGSVVSGVVTTWFLKRLEKTKRQSEAMGNWRIVDRPGVVRSTSHAQPPLGGKPGAEFNFAPMSMHKQKLLASTSGLDSQTLRASHLSPPFSSSIGICSNTPHSSYCSPASFKGSNTGHGSQEEIALTHVPVQPSDTVVLSSCNEKCTNVDEDVPSALDPTPKGNNVPQADGKMDNPSLDNSCLNSRERKPKKGSRKCLRTCSGLSDEFLSSIHSGSGSGHLLDSYGEGDLTNDWKEILGAVDKMLAEHGEPPLDKGERSVAMKTLLNASESDGVDLALEGALDGVLHKRRGPIPEDNP